MQVSRWIYGFRSVGVRELSEGERSWLRSIGTRHLVSAFAKAGVAFIFVTMFLFGLGMATDGRWYGWAVLVGSLVVLVWGLSAISSPFANRSPRRRPASETELPTTRS